MRAGTNPAMHRNILSPGRSSESSFGHLKTVGDRQATRVAFAHAAVHLQSHHHVRTLHSAFHALFLLIPS